MSPDDEMGRIRAAAKRNADRLSPPTPEEITWLREELGPMTYEDIARLRPRRAA